MVEERRLLTVLFADLSGFTALSSKLDPEEVRETANFCFERLNKVITDQGGTIHKYEGDMVMALFGHPLAHEDDPERGIKAAFEMLELIPEINRDLSERLQKGIDLGLHAGINAGTVVVGEVGSSEKRELTVMGDVVNLGSRLKDVAQRGEVIVSEPVFRASRYLFEYEAREPVAVKGVAETVRVFRPIKRKEKPEPKRGIQGLASPMVGRDRELGELKHRAELVAEGKGGATFVLGDVGLGKTRLWEELKGWLARERLAVSLLEGRCRTHGESVPYGPLLLVLKVAFGIADKDSREGVREKVLKETKGLFPDSWKEVAPYLGCLLSVRFETELDEKVKYLDAQGLKSQIQISLRKLLSAVARTKPVLLVLEDYQWIDPESLAFLEFLFDSPAPIPLLLLVLSRPEKEKKCYQVKERLRAKLGNDFQEMILEPLSPGAGSRLINNLLKAPGFPEELKDRLLARVLGNPFYLEEILRSLIDSETLTYRDGSWVLTREVDSLAIPDNVQAVIASRLDRLEKEVRDILQTAAVFGQTFSVPLLQRLSQVDELMLTLYLATLEEHEYISEKAKEGEREYAFRHPLFQQVAYNGLLKKHRGELHRRAGEAIEALYPDRLDDFTELLANQYASGDDPGKALEWLWKAGRKAKERYANEEAIGYFRDMIFRLEKDGRRRTEELCGAYQALGEIHHLRGEYQEALDCYRTLIRLAGDRLVLQAMARVESADIYLLQNRFDEALKVLEEAEGFLSGRTTEERVEKADVFIARSRVYLGMEDKAKAREAGRKALEMLDAERTGRASRVDGRIFQVMAKGYGALGRSYINAGEWDDGLKCFQEQLALSEETGDKGELCSGFNNISTIYLYTSDYEKAVSYLERAKIVAEEIGRRPMLAKVYNKFAIEYRRKGDFGRALEFIHQGLAIHEELGEKQSACNLMKNLGLVHYDRGEYAQARDCFLKSLGLAEDIGYKHGIAGAESNLGYLLFKEGKYQEADARYQRALEISREIGDKNFLMEYYNDLADMNSELAPSGSPPPPEALNYMEQASRLAEELKYPVFQADCDKTSGKIYSRAGEFRKAEELFQKALPVFEACNEKESFAFTCLEYGRMLERAREKGETMKGRAEDFFTKARALYEELNMPHMVKECQRGEGEEQAPRMQLAEGVTPGPERDG